MRGLEQEGWLKRLAPGWSSAKANVAELEKLREIQMQLQMQGIVANASAAQFPLLTAKMAAKDMKALKKSFPRRGFVAEIDALEGEAKRFAAELGAKQAADGGAAGGGAVGCVLHQERGVAGEVPELLYGVVAGAAEGSVCADAGDEDRCGAGRVR
jgi:hypothetical protein